MKKCKTKIASLILAMVFLFFVVSLLSTNKHVCTHGDGIECQICEAYNDHKEQMLYAVSQRSDAHTAFVTSAIFVLFIFSFVIKRESPVLLKDKITG